jgi:hypothetical protein
MPFFKSIAARPINKKLGIKVVSDIDTLDLFRGIRSQLTALLNGLDPKDLATMSLGLSHSLSRCVPYQTQVWSGRLNSVRFKLKFSPDKVDTMIVQAIALLDDLDKEINIYSMRVKVCDSPGSWSRVVDVLLRNGTVGISQSCPNYFRTTLRMPRR